MDDTTSDTLAALRQRLPLLVASGFRLHLMPVRVHQRAGERHASRNFDCVDPDEFRGTEVITLEDLLTSGVPVCSKGTCADVFEPEAQGPRRLPVLFDAAELLLEQLAKLEDPSISLTEALEASKALRDLFRPTQVTAEMMTAELRDRRTQALRALDVRRVSPEGVTHALNCAAEVMFPLRSASSALSDGSRAQVDDLTRAQRRAATSCPNWVLAVYPDSWGGTQDEPCTVELMSIAEAFTRKRLMCVPALVFDAINTVAGGPMTHVVIPGQPTDEVLETVRTLFAPSESGPYSTLEGAVSAALALA